MTYEYTAYVSSGNVNSADEVLRVTAEGEFVWNENADEMIASGDYSQHPALRHVLKALRENERLREAVKSEREACAKACEHLRDFFSGTSLAVDYENHSPSNSLAYTQCAAEIRARGEA